MVKKIVKNALSGTSLEEDYEGPSRQNLLPDQLKDQITYPNVHALASDYKLVSQSEASAYFPKDADPIKVNVGVSTKSNIEIPVRDSVCLDTYMDYKKSFILNTGGAIWSLDFCPKVPSKDSHPNIHYLAVAGYRSPDPERYPIDVYQPTGTYLNCIQIWRFDLSLRGAQRQPVLDMCLLHDYGIVIDAKWCPYGAYEEVKII
ncbi:hypothetical protein CLU79DRAFT_693757 [Phycomyces nitens]|nr:hypothetical protein CLU79DRAFT_693757 [Phycomyces nitens]